MLGVDARVLNLYFENITLPDLSAMRDKKSSMFLPAESVEPRRILFDLICAFAYAHSCGVTHNDVKPGNVMFDRHRGAVVCDWGLATVGPNYEGPKIRGNKPGVMMSYLVGTSWYLCPESRVGQLPEPPRDIFALGVLALWMLGHIPLPESLTEYRVQHPPHVRPRT
jgi:serine/threonine protein kinase